MPAGNRHAGSWKSVSEVGHDVDKVNAVAGRAVAGAVTSTLAGMPDGAWA